MLNCSNNKEILKISDLSEEYSFLTSRSGVYYFYDNSANSKLNLSDEKWSAYLKANCLLINKNLACLFLNNKILYYNLHDNEILRRVLIENHTFGTKLNDFGDLILFSGGKLYKYLYDDDRLELISNLQNKTKNYFDLNYIYYPYQPDISYSEKDNKIYYTVEYDDELCKIFILDIQNNAVTPIVDGYNPYFDGTHGTLYYISNENQLFKYNLETQKTDYVSPSGYTVNDYQVIDNAIFILVKEMLNSRNYTYKLILLEDKKIKFVIAKDFPTLFPPMDIYKYR
ncbi:MAG: hypothetical protein JXR64_13790 [Spirochaetales bacterium]|nr:hypothetical protein [Spirochaetales bacterium]